MLIRLNSLSTLCRVLKQKGYKIEEKEYKSLQSATEPQYKRFLALVATQKLSELRKMANQFNVYDI